MALDANPIDLQTLCRRLFTEWQYHCPYIANKKLSTIVLPNTATEPKSSSPTPKEEDKKEVNNEVNENETGEPKESGYEADNDDTDSIATNESGNSMNASPDDENDDQKSEDDGSSTSESSSGSTSSSDCGSGSSTSTCTDNACLMLVPAKEKRIRPTFNYKVQATSQITTFKNFFKHCTPKLELEFTDLEKLYWGLRLRCVPMNAKYFCYAILATVKQLQELGHYTGLRLPNGKLIPMCNLRMRNFKMQPDNEVFEGQWQVRITETQPPGDPVSLQYFMETDANLVDHTVIVARCLDGKRYMIDPTLIAYQLPTLEVTNDSETNEIKYVKKQLKPEQKEEGTAAAAASTPLLKHYEHWDAYIDYISSNSFLGKPDSNSTNARCEALRWQFWDRREALPQDPVLDVFMVLLKCTTENLPEYTTSIHAAIASVITNIDEEYCAYCGEIERPAGENQERVELVKCGKCNLVSYCSVQCQKADLAVHRDKCRRRPRKRKAEHIGFKGFPESPA